MHIQNRKAMVIFGFVISVLAALAAWIQFLTFGDAAWRLLATWVALVAAVYYLFNSILTLFIKQRPVGTELCPMLQGGLIMSGITLILIHVVSYATDSYIPSAGDNAFLTGFLLPALMITFWVIFSTKGTWRAHDPFYWLAFQVIYFAGILVSGEFMPRTARLVYPYDFLNYPAIGIDTMLWWFAIFIAVILAVGYIFWLLDFALSGKLAEYIVLPKIKVIIVEEEIADETPMPAATEKPAPKPTTKKPAAEKPKSAEKSAPKSSAEKPVKLVLAGTREPAAENLDPPKVAAQPPSEPELPALPTVRIIEKINVDPQPPKLPTPIDLPLPPKN